MGRLRIVEDGLREPLPYRKGMAMDRNKPMGKALLSVKRGFFNSRLAGEHSASVYEIIIPEITRVVSGKSIREQLGISAKQEKVSGA